jgi:hypothetical protein
VYVAFASSSAVGAVPSARHTWEDTLRKTPARDKKMNREKLLFINYSSGHLRIFTNQSRNSFCVSAKEGQFTMMPNTEPSAGMVAAI